MKIVHSLNVFRKLYFSLAYWRNSFFKILNNIFILLGVAWLLISMTDYFFSSNVLHKTYTVFWLIVLVCFVISIIFIHPPYTFLEKINGKDISIRVVVGDIFYQNGDKVISSNSTFDTSFQNDFISPNSIQGQLTKREYDDVYHLDQEIERALNGTPVKEVLNRSTSKKNRYDIGTIIKIAHRSNFKSYWVALADVNEHGKPDGKFENLQVCLEKLWDFVSKKGHMNKLVVPLLGTGRTGINESRFDIFKEIIFSFVVFSNEKKITEELVICISPNDIANKTIDIYEVQDYLRYQCKYRYEKSTNRASSTGVS